jgi:S-methyl-5-thioribose-1-phosphate isomerase
MKVKGKDYRAAWMQDGSVFMIDQLLLPHEFKIIELKNHTRTCEAIRNMTVRGAGSIGAAAGFAAAQVVLDAPAKEFDAYLSRGFEAIKKTRPTAQDLFFAVEKVAAAVKGISGDEAKTIAVRTANDISDEYSRAGEAIGKLGSDLIKDGFRILTHCNAGWIALQDWGSALAPIYTAHRSGKKVFVYVDETRPRLQGAKLTAWELSEEGVDYAVIADNAAGFYMQKKMIDMVIVGSDRIAANGDIANKIGTYEKAVVAKENNIPFYVAAPVSTIDMKCPSGSDIPIEERDEDEVKWIQGKTETGEQMRIQITPDGAKAKNPAFDVTPAKYITAIITDKGIVKPESIPSLFS